MNNGTCYECGATTQRRKGKPCAPIVCPNCELRLERHSAGVETYAIERGSDGTPLGNGNYWGRWAGKVEY